MALLDDILTGIVVLLIILAVVTFLELKYLRKVMHRRKTQSAAKADLPDRAHNALLTSKAISRALADAGVFTDNADAVIREAEVAYGARNYRVVVDLADRAKGMLHTEKARHASMGDLARLERSGARGSAEETTKELLQKEYPPNYAQAKFTITLAEQRIEAAQREGRATDDANRLVRSARDRFAAEDYAAALGLAAQARKSADGEAIVAPAGQQHPLTASAGSPTGPVCGKCGAGLDAGDAFCRKCGTPVP